MGMARAAGTAALGAGWGGGWAGWGVGAAVGLMPIVARVVPGLGACRWLPMAVIAYLAAFATYQIARMLGA